VNRDIVQQTAEALDTPKVDFHPGEVWMPHRELAVLRGSKFPVECRGNVVVDSVSNGQVEASCDRCQFTVVASSGQVARSLQTRPEPWWQR
jgi:hypothetical protein